MKSGDRETVGEEGATAGRTRPAQPGLVLVFGPAGPAARTLPLDGDRLVLGRDLLHDERVSREHAEVSHSVGRWTVRDLGSRNGTFVDAVPVGGELVGRAPRVVRVGGSLVLPVADLVPLREAGVLSDESCVAGPLLQAALDRARSAVAEVLLIGGESGSGKELAARAFHQAGPHVDGPFVAVNCAAIPEGVAERLFFGARKGAYSGAEADAEGYLQAAHRGTLFLDEIAELDPNVQAKLLRAIETREVLPLGAARAQPIDVRVVAASHRDLRAEVAKGSFRADLYFRLDQADVRLPPLRARPEEIPFLVARALARMDPPLSAHARFVEACLLRPWPGNVRELLSEVRRAAGEALRAGAGQILVEHLRERAGTPLGEEHAPAAGSDGGDGEGEREPDRDALVAALAAQRGNVAATARALGVHRTQLYRWLKRHGLRQEED